MKPLVIFDLDGTLIDTSEGIIKCYKWVTHMYDLKKYSDEELRSFIGFNLFNVFKTKFNLNDIQTEEVIEEYRRRYKEKGIYEALVYRDMPDLIKILKYNNYNIAVATLKSEPLAMLILDNFGLTFDFVVGMDKSESLTKAQLIRTCIDKFKTNLVFMVGDSENDNIGAKENNIPFIRVDSRRF